VFENAPLFVRQRLDGLKVIGADTKPVSTRVIDFVAGRHGPNERFVRDYVRLTHYRLAALGHPYTDFAVRRRGSLVARCNPNPTPGNRVEYGISD
jgi:hypothetical protein